MACHFAPPSEFRTPQKHQLSFFVKKASYAQRSLVLSVGTESTKNNEMIRNIQLVNRGFPIYDIEAFK